MSALSAAEQKTQHVFVTVRVTFRKFAKIEKSLDIFLSHVLERKQRNASFFLLYTTNLDKTHMFLEQICPGQVNSQPHAIHTFCYQEDRYIVSTISVFL